MTHEWKDLIASRTPISIALASMFVYLKPAGTCRSRQREMRSFSPPAARQVPGRTRLNEGPAAMARLVSAFPNSDETTHHVAHSSVSWRSDFRSTLVSTLRVVHGPWTISAWRGPRQGPKTQDGDFVTLGRAPQDDLGRGAQDGGGRRPALRCLVTMADSNRVRANAARAHSNPTLRMSESGPFLARLS